MRTPASFSEAARGAWSEGLFARFPTKVGEALAESAVPMTFVSGETIEHHTKETAGLVFLVVDGLARIFVSSESGREMTVRYASRGHIVGLPALAAGHSNPSIAVKAVIDTACLALPAAKLGHLASHDAEVAWPIARYVAETLHSSEQLWSRNMFLPVPPRVAYHLLELCTREGSELVVRATQDEVAHAVGSVREVVARTLREFEQAGLIRRASGQVHLLDPAGLHRLAAPDPA